MPVVINEFEVVADSASASAAAPASEPPNEIATPPAFEIERIERFLAERALRIWAH
jgi:hypothetical protein